MPQGRLTTNALAFVGPTHVPTLTGFCYVRKSRFLDLYWSTELSTQVKQISGQAIMSGTLWHSFNHQAQAQVSGPTESSFATTFHQV
ncbi:hypothetical protein F442_22436, partial [Phytophthora nicotianae P10297]